MAAPSPKGITQLLERWSHGDEAALEQLMPLVYSELRKLAGIYLRRERREHTLQPTALVNEAYLRLVDQQGIEWQNRAQFFGLAARLMRNILVDQARARRAEKRGGSHYSISLSRADRVTRQPQVDLVALNDVQWLSRTRMKIRSSKRVALSVRKYHPPFNCLDLRLLVYWAVSSSLAHG